MRDPQGNTLSYKYDDRGNLEATDAQGGPNPDGSSSRIERQTRLRYNKEGMDSSKRTGPNGTLRSSTEGKGTDATEDSDTWKRYTTTYHYDAKGNLIKEDPPGEAPSPAAARRDRRCMSTTTKAA